MSARPVPEWIGKTPETALPLRVKLRIVARQNTLCAGCTRKLDGLMAFDHRPALINGGENRESKIEAVCAECHKPRTRADVKEKSLVARKRAKHIGLKKSKHPMPGSRNSAWKKRMDGTTVRRGKKD